MIINKVKEKLSEGKNIKRETIIDLVNDYDALNYGINSMRQDYLPLVSERDALKAENERILGVSEIQRGFFNAAMDRAEKAEKELDTWKDLTEQRGEELAVALKQLEICGNELDTTREQLLCVQDDYLDMRDRCHMYETENQSLQTIIFQIHEMIAVSAPDYPYTVYMADTWRKIEHMTAKKLEENQK